MHETVSVSSVSCLIVVLDLQGSNRDDLYRVTSYLRRKYRLSRDHLVDYMRTTLRDTAAEDQLRNRVKERKSDLRHARVLALFSKTGMQETWAGVPLKKRTLGDEATIRGITMALRMELCEERIVHEAAEAQAQAQAQAEAQQSITLTVVPTGFVNGFYGTPWPLVDIVSTPADGETSSEHADEPTKEVTQLCSRELRSPAIKKITTRPRELSDPFNEEITRELRIDPGGSPGLRLFPVAPDRTQSQSYAMLGALKQSIEVYLHEQNDDEVPSLPKSASKSQIYRPEKETSSHVRISVADTEPGKSTKLVEAGVLNPEQESPTLGRTIETSHLCEMSMTTSPWTDAVQASSYRGKFVEDLVAANELESGAKHESVSRWTNLAKKHSRASSAKTRLDHAVRSVYVADRIPSAGQ